MDAAKNFRLVMNGFLAEQAGAMFDRPAFRVIRPEIEAAQARMADRTGTHVTWLQGDPNIII